MIWKEISTKRQILLLNNINPLIIGKRFSIDNERLYRLTNLQQLYINDSEISFHVLLYNRITALFIVERRFKINSDNFVQFVYNMFDLRSLGAPLVLIKMLFVSHWSSIRRLEILTSWPTVINYRKKLNSRWDQCILSFFYSYRTP